MFPKQKSRSDRILYLIIGSGMYLLALFFLAHYFYIQEAVRHQYVQTANLLLAAEEHMLSHPLELSPFPLRQTGSAAFVLLILALAILAGLKKKNRMLPGREEGSARWNENLQKYNKAYTDPIGSSASAVSHADPRRISRNMLLTRQVSLSMDTRATLRNNNVLVIGGSGSGKSRYVVKPNLLQMNCSYVITDPSGELLEGCGKFLEDQGYRVLIFNLVEMQYSDHYNPFNYIRNDEGVMMMIHCLIENTTPKGAARSDPFWQNAETALLLAICFYLQYEICPEDRNFTNVMRMLLLAQVRESEEDFKSPLDIIYEKLEKENPGHIAVRYYRIFKMGAGKTLKSILISCTVRLGTFNLKAVQRLTNTDTLDLTKIGDTPTALFVVIPSADTTFNHLVSMMYSQLFESLIFHAENECPGKRLPVPVRFLQDEFANCGTIPDYEKKLAIVRKYEISCTIVLQNLAQLKTMYKDAWESITGNCDTLLFLGGQEQTTLEYISKKLGKVTLLANGYSRSRGGQGSRTESENIKGRDLMAPDEISRMDNRDCILFIRGMYPFYGKKYSYTGHPNYKYTGDADPGNIYHYRTLERFAKSEADPFPEILAESVPDLTTLGEDCTDLSGTPSGQAVNEKRAAIQSSFGGRLATPENLAMAAGLAPGTDLEEIASHVTVREPSFPDYEFDVDERQPVS